MLSRESYKPGGGGGGEATRPRTEKQCSHNLQSDPLGSGFKKGRENFQWLAARALCFLHFATSAKQQREINEFKVLWRT